MSAGTLSFILVVSETKGGAQKITVERMKFWRY